MHRLYSHNRSPINRALGHNLQPERIPISAGKSGCDPGAAGAVRYTPYATNRGAQPHEPKRNSSEDEESLLLNQKSSARLAANQIKCNEEENAGILPVHSVEAKKFNLRSMT